MSQPSVVALCLLFLPAGAAAGPGRPVELTGIVTQMAGSVVLAGPGVDVVPLAHPWQVLRRGVTVRVPEGGAAGIACSSRHFVALRGPAFWSLSAEACAAGKELTPADYALVAPRAGVFNVVQDRLVLDRKTRGGDDDDPLAPLVLSPRPLVLRRPRPVVSWLRVPRATEYQVEWIGRGTGTFRTRIDAGAVACGVRADGLDACSLPWPAERPDLAPDETFFLAVQAREGLVDPLRGNDPVRVRTLSVAASQQLERRLADLAALGLTGAALDTAQAGLLATWGLYADAAELYQRALAGAPSPELRVTLADVKLGMGLLRQAEPLYRQAQAEGEPAVRAAAAFGLGRLLYARRRDAEAVAAFRQAAELYAGLHLAEEAVAARTAARAAGSAENRSEPLPSPAIPRRAASF